MPQKDVTVRLEVKSPSILEDLKGVISGQKEIRLLNSSEKAPCDILIHELGDDVRRELQLIRDLTDNGLVGEFFLTSSRIEPDVLVQALRAGAKEFIPQPVNADEVRHCLENALQRHRRDASARSETRQGVIIDVLGSKGGVGTTTTAVNLAASLKRLKNVESVALIDMNLLFGEVPLFLDIKPAYSWGEIVRNIARLDSAYLMGIMAQHRSGIHVLPPPTQLESVEVGNPETIERILQLMQEEFDYIVIDSGQSLDSISLKILELSDLLLLVSIPSLPCLINVKRLLETFGSLGYPPEPRVKVVMNRYHKKSVISAREAEEGIQRKVSWTIPNDYQTTMSAINQGKLVSDISGKSEISRNFLRLATELSGEVTDRRKQERGQMRLR